MDNNTAHCTTLISKRQAALTVAYLLEGFVLLCLGGPSVLEVKVILLLLLVLPGVLHSHALKLLQVHLQQKKLTKQLTVVHRT